MSRHVQLTVDDPRAPLLERLAEATGLGKRVLKDTLQKGALWLTRGKSTRRLRRAKAALRAGDVLDLYYDATVLAAEPPPALLLADHERYSAWFKPRGMLSQGSKWGDHCTIGRWAERTLRPERSAFVVHRLDRATAGVILLAHTKQAARELSARFAERRVAKTYRAIVSGEHPPEARYETAIDGRPALTTARRVDVERGRSLVEVTIETGRKHQIRKHLSAAGFPIEGDRLHGQASPDDVDLQLCAIRLELSCPLCEEPRRFEAPPEAWPTL